MPSSKSNLNSLRILTKVTKPRLSKLAITYSKETKNTGEKENTNRILFGNPKRKSTQK